MILKNKMTRVVRIGGVTLMPGANTLDEKQEEGLRLYGEAVKERVDNGVFELMDMDLDEFLDGTGNGITDITELNTREAVALVKETVDMSTLRAFQNAESEGEDRKGVQTAIEKQVAKVEEMAKDEDEE
jgi:hypothetical protein